MGDKEAAFYVDSRDVAVVTLVRYRILGLRRPTDFRVWDEGGGVSKNTLGRKRARDTSSDESQYNSDDSDADYRSAQPCARVVATRAALTDKYVLRKAREATTVSRKQLEIGKYPPAQR